MPKRLPPRPNYEFTIDSFECTLDSERKNIAAEYQPVSATVLRRRFFQFLEFLWLNGLLVKQLANSDAEITLDTKLLNSHVTDLGFLFCQKYHGRWVDRTSKDAGPAKEWAFLVKWYENDPSFANK